MSAVTYTRPPNRLAKLIAAPGGRKLTDAVAVANANIAAIRGSLLQEVDAALERLRVALGSAEDAPVARTEVYNETNGLAGLAGLCGLERMGQVAYNLCELSDRYVVNDRWNQAAVAAHVDTMSVLRMTGDTLGSEAGEAVLAGLKELVRRVEDSAGRIERTGPP